MADVTLVAELRANIDGYEKNIQSAVKSTVDGSKQIDVAVGKAAQSIKGINPASGQAAFALTNLGRVASDSAYGPIAISNNIDPLVSSLVGLAKTAKETGTTFTQALVSSLAGGGGITLAFSLASAAISFAAVGLRNWVHTAKDAKKETEDYVSSLDNLRQAQVKGEQSAAQETTRLNILYNAVNNTTLSLKDRNAAYDELASKYPKFFANSTNENRALTVSVDSYNKLTTAILQSAYAKAYEDKITQNANRQIENRQKILDLTIAESKARKELNDFEARSKDRGLVGGINGSGTTAGAGAGDTGRAGQINFLASKLNEIIAQKNNLLTDTGILEQRNGELSKAATTAEAAAGFKTGQQLDDKIQKLTKQRDILEQLGATDASVRAQNAFTPILLSTPDLSGFAAILAKYNEIVAAQKIYHDQQAVEKNNLQEINQLFGNGLVNAFQSAIQGTQSFVGAMGQYLTQLISKLVAAAAAAAVLGTLLQFTGLGAILNISSAGSSFGSLFKGLSGLNFLAEGGVTNGPTLAMIGEGREKEIVTPVSKYEAAMNNARNEGGGKVVFEISGTKLRGVLQREDKSAQRTK